MIEARIIGQLTETRRVQFLKGHEYYEVRYDPERQRGDAVVQLRRWAQNPELSLTGEDAYVMARAVNAKFANVTCSQCGKSFGAGDHGWSHCSDHG